MIRWAGAIVTVIFTIAYGLTIPHGTLHAIQAIVAFFACLLACFRRRADILDNFGVLG